MAVVSELENQPAQAGTAVPPKRIPSYMRPTKTSSQKIEDVKPKSKVLNPKDTNQAKRVLSESVPKGMKSTLVKTELVVNGKDKGKENKDVKAGTLALVHMTTENGSQKKTLGKLFTDGGLEEMLIKVLCYLSFEALLSCLKVCKNANAVMTKTSAIQGRLRFILYGLGKLPTPARYQPLVEKLHEGTHFTSHEAVQAVIDLQSRIEFSTIYQEPLLFPSGLTLEDSQHDHFLGSEADRWLVISREDRKIISARRHWARSTLALCSEDGVLVEAQRMTNEIRMSFAGLNSGETRGVSVTHPAAAFQWLVLCIPAQPVSYTDPPLKVRLHPGGLAVVVTPETHLCSTAACRDLTGRDKLSDRLVMINWKLGTGLGVIKVHGSRVPIFDAVCLDDSRIIVSSLRFIGEKVHPCIDVYEIPQIAASAPQQTIHAHRLPSLHHVASLLFPSLAMGRVRLECLTSYPSDRSTYISTFDMKLPRLSRQTLARDQVVSFRFEGWSDGLDESVQGVISVSRLLARIPKASGYETQGPPQPGSLVQKTTSTATLLTDTQVEPVRIPWAQWSSGVALQPARTTTALEPVDVRTFTIARSRTDRTRAVLVIRDYNQRMLFAPSGHLTRNLGNGSQHMHARQATITETFHTVTDTKAIESRLFGGLIEYGLGHRQRLIDLGTYKAHTCTSRTFWGKKHLVIDPGDSSGTLSYMIAYKPTLLCRCGRAHLHLYVDDTSCSNRGDQPGISS